MTEEDAELAFERGKPTAAITRKKHMYDLVLEQENSPQYFVHLYQSFMFGILLNSNHSRNILEEGVLEGIKEAIHRNSIFTVPKADIHPRFRRECREISFHSR